LSRLDAQTDTLPWNAITTLSLGDFNASQLVSHLPSCDLDMYNLSVSLSF